MIIASLFFLTEWAGIKANKKPQEEPGQSQMNLNLGFHSLAFKGIVLKQGDCTHSSVSVTC